jgi:hypothetical protein
MRNSHEAHDRQKGLETLDKELAELTRGGVDLGKNTTVVIKNDGKSAKTMVKTDDRGSYVIVADPDKHLTAHDKAGKLLFDGAIESPEQQKKVPKAVWERIKPMLDEMDAGKKALEPPAAQRDAPEAQKP